MNDANKSVAIFILIDGLGWPYLQRQPFLDDILTQRSHCRTVLGYSSSALPTILSGLYPFQSDHGNYYYFSPKASPWKWTKLFSQIPFDRIPRLGNRLHEFLLAKSWQRSGYTGYLQHNAIPLEYLWLFGYNERTSIFHDHLIHGQTVFDYLKLSHTPFFLSTYPRPDADSLSLAVNCLRNEEIRFHFLYLSEMDGVLHTACHQPEVVQARLDWYAEKIHCLYEAAVERWQNVHLYIFSDHGMTPVVGTYDLASEVDQLGLTIPQDYIPFYDSTMARFWFANSRAMKLIIGKLRQITVGHILSLGELESYGAAFPNNKFGDLTFLLSPGYVITPNFISKTAPAGMHGYTPDDIWSDAVFMTNIDMDTTPKSIAEFFPIMMKEYEQIR